jgi:hypothetical protein
MTPRHYVCGRANAAPEIDGRLDTPFWVGAAWSDPFVDILGHSAPVPRFRTRMKMLWDDEFLYIGAELEEPHVWGTLTQRDAVIFHDNDFEVFLDPDGDNHLYAELEINALNTVWDLLLVRPYRDGGPAVTGWDIPGLRTGVSIRGTLNDPSDVDEGWSVEIAIPWKALKELCGSASCPPKVGDQWRINFSRVQWEHEIVEGEYRRVKGKSEDNWVWSPQGAIDMHRPEDWGVLQFGQTGLETALDLPGSAERSELMRVYYAQKAFHKDHCYFAKSLAELDLTSDVWLGGTENVYEARLGGWRIDHTSRLTRS